MTKDELIKFVTKENEEKGKNAAEIAEELRKRGHKSPRSGKPIKAETVRGYLSTGVVGRGGSKLRLAQSALDMIHSVVSNNDLDKDKKLSLIRSYLKTQREGG